MKEAYMVEKILVIDDTPVIRDFLKDVLVDIGFQVDMAGNGKEGLDLVQSNDYLLIFCDVHMPVMNGLQAIFEIKKVRPEIPIIMTDSFPDREAKEADRLGAICCLAKPFDLQELKATINNVMKRKTVAAK
jgi:DNA-binding response OmpR family regulator